MLCQVVTNTLHLTKLLQHSDQKKIIPEYSYQKVLLNKKLAALVFIKSPQIQGCNLTSKVMQVTYSKDTAKE